MMGLLVYKPVFSRDLTTTHYIYQQTALSNYKMFIDSLEGRSSLMMPYLQSVEEVDNTTVNYTFNIDDVPTSPTQHVEFTVIPKIQMRRSLRKERLKSDRDGHFLHSVSENIRQIRCYSRDGSGRGSIEKFSRQHSSLSNPKSYQRVGEVDDSLYDISANITGWKYSHIDRMALLKKFTR